MTFHLSVILVFIRRCLALTILHFWMIRLAFTKRNLSLSLSFLSPISFSSLAFLAAFLQWVSSVCSSKNQCLSKVQLLFSVRKKKKIGRKGKMSDNKNKRKAKYYISFSVCNCLFLSLFWFSRNLRECAAKNWTMRTILFVLLFFFLLSIRSFSSLPFISLSIWYPLIPVYDYSVLLQGYFHQKWKFSHLLLSFMPFCLCDIYCASQKKKKKLK